MLTINNKLLLVFFIFMAIMFVPKATQPLVDTKILNKIAKIDLKQLGCLSTNIFYEAGGETLLGQAAVARVVMNRVRNGFAKTPCGVVYQYTVNDDNIKMCQFSWVCEGKSNPNKNSAQYKKAESIALAVLSQDAYSEVIPKTALFFHNLSVDPNWPYKQVAVIGNHIFYSKAKKSP